MIKQHSLLSLFAVSIIATPAIAEVPLPADLGVIVKYEQSLYKNGKAKVSPGLGKIDRTGFDIRGPKWSFVKTDNTRYYLGASLDDFDADRGDSPELQDMRELDTAINLRVGGAWKMNAGVANIDVAQDVAAHKGTQVKARYTFNPAPHQSSFKPYAEAQWLSSKVVDNYVGVSASDAKAGRPAYTAGSSIAYKAGINALYPISDKLTVIGEVHVTHYGDEFKNSPIVDETTVMGAHIGMTYRWK